MNAFELVAELSRVGVKLSVVGEHLRIDAPMGVLTPALRHGLSQYKAEIMAALGAPISLPSAEEAYDPPEPLPPSPPPPAQRPPAQRPPAGGYSQGPVIWASAASPIQAVASAVQRERPDLRSYTAPDGTVTIFFTDIEGSTAMTDRLGDRQWMALLRDHSAIIREQITANKGFEVKAIGDGFMVAFPSARSSLRCAIDIQRALEADNQQRGGDPILVRIGVHSGEPIKEGDDFFGRDVVLAARLSEEAEGGEILASPVVKELTESNGEFDFEEEREVEVRGLSGRHTAFEVRWQPESSRYEEIEEATIPAELGRDGHRDQVNGSKEDQQPLLPTPEAKGSQEVSNLNPDFLDVNLVGGLVRWAFQAKQRIGHERLMDMLELYLRSGRCSLELTEIIGHICSMVEEGPAYESDPAQESVDLMHQLHGILAGGVPITHRPATKFGNGESREQFRDITQ